MSPTSHPEVTTFSSRVISSFSSTMAGSKQPPDAASEPAPHPPCHMKHFLKRSPGSQAFSQHPSDHVSVSCWGSSPLDTFLQVPLTLSCW